MPDPKQQVERGHKLPAVCELLPIRDLLDNVMVRLDGCYVAGYRLRGSRSYFASEEDRNDLKARVDALIRTCPEESMRIQIRYEVNDQIPGTIEKYLEERRTTNEAARRLDDERVRVYREKMQKGEYLTRSLTIYFIWDPVVYRRVLASQGRKLTSKAGQPSFSLSIKQCITAAREEHEATMAQFEALLRGVEGSMAAASLGHERMTHQELCLDIQNALSPLSSVRTQYKPHPLSIRYRSAREQLSNCFIDANETYISIDNVLWSIVTLKEPPEQTFPGIIRELQTLGFPLVISTNINIPNQMKVLDVYKKRHKKMLAAQVDHRGNQRLDMAAMVAADDLAEIQSRIMGSSTKAVQVSLSVAFRTSFAYRTGAQLEIAEQQLADRREEILHVMSRMDGASGLPEAVAQTRILVGMLPGLACKDSREHELLSAHAADLSPVEMPWSGTERSSMILFPTPYRQLIPFSPFDPSLENANAIIVGASGSGKSMLVQKLILTAGRQDVKVSILERGDSYQNTVRFIGGKTITMSLDSDLTINPFDLEKGATKLSNDHRSFLVNLIRHMIGDAAQSDVEILNSVLETSIQAAYERSAMRSNPIPTLSDVRDELENYLDKNKREVVMKEAHIAAVKLGAWVDDGLYANLFDRHTTVDMDTNWLYFNVEKLKDDPRLETAMSLLIAYATTKRADGSSGTRCITVLDECWALLDSPTLGLVVEQLFRTARKRNACVWGVSQAVEDFTGTPDKPKRTGGAILATTSLRFIGRQKGNLDVLYQFLHLSPAAIERIKGLGMTEKGERSEFISCIGEETQLTHSLYIELVGDEYWLATSFPRERLYRNFWIASHPYMDFASAIRLLAKKYPNGLARVPELPEERSGAVKAAYENPKAVARYEAQFLEEDSSSYTPRKRSTQDLYPGMFPEMNNLPQLEERV
jgi:hypothetical protein